MLAPDLFARNAEDEEVSLEIDGDVAQGFAKGEQTAHIVDQRHHLDRIARRRLEHRHRVNE